MQATNEIRNILAKGQAKAGANPLAVLDGIMSGDALEAVAGGIGMGDSSAAYAKMAKLRTERRASLSWAAPATKPTTGCAARRRRSAKA